LEDLEALRGKLEGIYKTEAFQEMLLKRNDLAGAFQRRDVLTDDKIKEAGKDKLNLESLVIQLKKD